MLLRILILTTLPLAAQTRVLTTVVPSLAYGPSCKSTIQLRNISDRTVTLDLVGHRESGALVPLVDLPDTSIHLAPHQQGAYKLDIAQETTASWAEVREQIPSPDLSPAIAITAATECIIGNQLRTAPRGVSYPIRNPWFSGDVAEIPANLIALINTSESSARATACYSTGSLYSVAGGPLQPVCTATLDVQIPPLSSRQFPVARDGNSYFSLKTLGDAIVLEMLHPIQENLRIYAVDSSITFGSEAPDKP